MNKNSLPLSRFLISNDLPSNPIESSAQPLLLRLLRRLQQYYLFCPLLLPHLLAPGFARH